MATTKRAKVNLEFTLVRAELNGVPGKTIGSLTLCMRA